MQAEEKGPQNKPIRKRRKEEQIRSPAIGIIIEPTDRAITARETNIVKSSYS